MRVSSRGEYGLRALYDLAEHYDEGPVSSAAISKRQHIPQDYLNQLLIVLRHAGFIRSARGRRGGHQLARSPQKIRLRDAVRALDGTTAPIDCIETKSCDDQCPYCDVWQEIKQATDEILNGKTLADIARKY